MPASSTTVFDQPATLMAWSDAHRVAGRTVALVPTMGALHDGHLALVAEARRHADVVVVSIFVNPLQFNRSDDFDAYPRPLDDDLALCREHGVDAVYAPRAAAMYPPGFATHVEPGPLGELLEGAHRPHHFRGVATVVAKLFGAARPHVAVFGQKDYQQLAIIRNRRLSPAERAAATCVPRSLQAVADALSRGVAGTAELAAVGRAVVQAEPLARFEHLEIVDADTLQPLTTIHDRAVAVTAVWFGQVRLIDNRLLAAGRPA